MSRGSPYLNNNLMYMGGQALYAPTFKYERNPNCLVSGQGVDLEVSPAATLTHLVRRPPRHHPAQPATSAHHHLGLARAPHAPRGAAGPR